MCLGILPHGSRLHARFKGRGGGNEVLLVKLMPMNVGKTPPSMLDCKYGIRCLFLYTRTESLANWFIDTARSS